MKKIKELKKGDKIYSTNLTQVKWYSYLCRHNVDRNYHILIDNSDEPLKVHNSVLEAILAQNLNSYDDALNALANKLEALAAQLRKELKQK